MELELLKNSSNKTQQNVRELYSYIRSHGPISRTELQMITGYKLTTLVRTLGYLLETGLIYGCKIGESTGGRKPTLYSISSNEGFIVGVDISRTYTKVALMDLQCNVIKSHTFGIFTENYQTATLKKISSLINEFCSGIDRRKILGIGVGIVGSLNRKSGALMNSANFPTSDWENICVKSELERETGLFTIIENGANAAAFGEYKKGIAAKCNSIAYIISGMGLRLGTTFNGIIVRNDIVSENTFAHTAVDINGEECSCGNKGCLETYATIPAILKSFVNEIKAGKYSTVLEKVDFDLNSINIDIFCEAVNTNDKLALEVINKSAEYFSVGLTNLINILNPELVILGGPLIKKCELFYDMSTSLAQKKISKILPYTPRFTRGFLEEDSVVVGCGNIVMDYFKI